MRHPSAARRRSIFPDPTNPMLVNFLRVTAAAAAVALLVGCSEEVTGPRRTPLTGTFAVGDLVRLNVNADSDCTAPVYHVARVEAIGAKAIIFNDTLNPKNGFGAADFQRFAAKFDTLIYPIDVAAFGEPTDIDDNGHVGIIFTRAVNELTPAQASSYVGGFTYSRDLFPREETNRAAACASSNEGEFFYLLAPDPLGEINGNQRSAAFVDQTSTGVIAHEFQHLINASRRLYVNTASIALEVPWLDEGLAHVAEELLFYREAALTPRANLGASNVAGTSQRLRAYVNDMDGNESRYKSYLQSPSGNSPYNNDDELPTRGAAWSFLRYLADVRAAAVAPTADPALRRAGTGTVSAPGAPAATSDYAAVVVNGSSNSESLTPFNIRMDFPVAIRASADEALLSANHSVLFAGAVTAAPAIDRRFEARLRARERRLMPQYAARARAWYTSTRPNAMMRRSSFDVVPGTSVDADSWFRLVNSNDTGIVNVQSAFGIDLRTAVRDWSVSNQVDDVAATIPPEYLQRSWNWRSIYTNLSSSSTQYPLVTRALPSGVSMSGSVIGGGASYFRFTVPVAATVTVTLTENAVGGGTPPAPSTSRLQLVLVRTR